MKLLDLLLENRVDYLKDWFFDLYTKQFHLNKEESLTKQVFNFKFKDLLEVDPTSNKRYSQWLITRILEKNKDYTEFLYERIFDEDAYKWREYLTIYDKVKPKLDQNLRDINKLSLEQLKNIALEYKEKEEEILTKNDYLDKRYKINETNQYLVYMFKTSTEKDFKMYQLVSTNTEWCTRPDYETFKNYINKSPLFVFIDKSNRNLKYQFHEQSNQFMDAEDAEIMNQEFIGQLLKLISEYIEEGYLFNPVWGSNGALFNKNGDIILNGFSNARYIKNSDNSKNKKYLLVEFRGEQISTRGLLYNIYNIGTRSFIINNKDFLYNFIYNVIIYNKYIIARTENNIFQLTDLDGNVIINHLKGIEYTSDKKQPFILVKDFKDRFYIVNLNKMTKTGPFISGAPYARNNYTFIVKPTETSASYEFTPYTEKFSLANLDGNMSKDEFKNIKTTKI